MLVVSTLPPYHSNSNTINIRRSAKNQHNQLPVPNHPSSFNPLQLHPFNTPDSNLLSCSEICSTQSSLKYIENDRQNISKSTKKKSRKLSYHFLKFYINVFYSLPRRDIYRIDGYLSQEFLQKNTERQTKLLQNRCSHIRKMCTQKKDLYLKQGPRKSHFPLNVSGTWMNIRWTFVILGQLRY